MKLQRSFQRDPKAGQRHLLGRLFVFGPRAVSSVDRLVGVQEERGERHDDDAGRSHQLSADIGQRRRAIAAAGDDRYKDQYNQEVKKTDEQHGLNQCAR